MVDIRKVNSLSPEEIELAVKLRSLLKDANQIVSLILKAYKFSMKELKIVVWSDMSSTEYLSHNGVWQGIYSGKKYEIVCTEQDVYEYLKAKYLVDNDFVSSYEVNGIPTEYGEKAIVCEYFLKFVERTKNVLMEEKTNGDN